MAAFDSEVCSGQRISSICPVQRFGRACSVALARYEGCLRRFGVDLSRACYRIYLHSLARTLSYGACISYISILLTIQGASSSMNGMRDHSVRQISLARKIAFIAIALSLSIVLLEIAIRSVLAFKVGPRVFLYGTSYFRNIPALGQGSGGLPIEGDVNAHRKGKHAAVGNTDLEIGTEGTGYAKYFPNESKLDYDENGQKFQVTINSHGFRGKDFTAAKPAGVVRIVTLGASSTFGYYDRDDETYPSLLEERLNQKEGKAARFEVVNLGIPHLTSAQILALFLKEGLPLAPDVVTFYEGINDSSLMPDKVWQEKVREGSETDHWLKSLKKSFGNLSFVRDIYHEVRDRLIIVALGDSLLLSDVITYTQQDLDAHIEGKSSRFLSNLATLRDLCRDRGILFVVMTQQARSMTISEVKGMTYEDEVRIIRDKLKATNQINHQEKTFLTHKILMDDLKTWAESEHVPSLDVIATLDRDRDVLLSWVHVNPRGNKMIAAALSDKILDELRRRTQSAKL